ncbi:DUF5395 family protein [Salinisphaera sp.]|uniref:DUF5395 family protein n=1 Tax=Salinisphaera sp. TaxID=1914330 RepID=UPI002D773F41|nr:DUF5395 family protein [Salinisphaera sp.]HET7314396.1 DUF5395 family protein [Salinisphaera sp.]
MRIAIELDYNGGRWHATGNGVRVSAPDLAGLDRRIEAALAESGDFHAGDQVLAAMTVRRVVLPSWLAQYAGHYFNRRARLTVAPQPERRGNKG